MKITRKTDPGDYPMWLVAAVLDELGMEITGVVQPKPLLLRVPRQTYDSMLPEQWQDGRGVFNAADDEGYTVIEPWSGAGVTWLDGDLRIVGSDPRGLVIARHPFQPGTLGDTTECDLCGFDPDSPCHQGLVEHQPTYTEVTGEGRVTTGWVAICSCGDWSVARDSFEETQDAFISHRDGPLSDDDGIGTLSAFVDLGAEGGSHTIGGEWTSSILENIIRNEHDLAQQWHGEPGHIAMVDDDGSLLIHQQTAEALGFSTDDVVEFPKDAGPGRVYHDPRGRAWLMSSYGAWQRTPSMDNPQTIVVEGLYIPPGTQAAPVVIEGREMRLTLNSPEPALDPPITVSASEEDLGPYEPVEGDMALTRDGILVWRERDGLMVLESPEAPQEPAAPREDLGALADAVEASAARLGADKWHSPSGYCKPCGGDHRTLTAAANPATATDVLGPHAISIEISGHVRPPIRVVCSCGEWASAPENDLRSALEHTSEHPEITNQVGYDGTMYPRREVQHAVVDAEKVHCSCGWSPLAGSGSLLLDLGSVRRHVAQAYSQAVEQQ